MRKKIFVIFLLLIIITFSIQLLLQLKKKSNVNMEVDSYKDESHFNEKKKIFSRM